MNERELLQKAFDALDSCDSEDWGPSPMQRLTDDEINDAYKRSDLHANSSSYTSFIDGVRFAETALIEKNK